MKVAVAMSGGVDSSVAALLLREQGHDIFGVHMRLHGATRDVTGRCCGVHEAVDAARVAETLGFPFFVVDLREEFERHVVSGFVEAWVAGQTPSPCIPCNSHLKFGALLQRARSAGADAVATGHYVRKIGPPDSPRLATARDSRKDQSYFLFSVGQEALRHALFPLGELTKAEVRERAARAGLPVAAKAESQEICFVPDDDHASFVAERLGEIDASGPIVDETGRVLGQHGAYYRYTIGQRRGLGVATGAPTYVIDIRAEDRTVVVGPPSSLLGWSFTFRNPTWYGEPDTPCEVRIRHRGELLPCEIPSPGRVVLTSAPARAITPGQAAVFYGPECDSGRPVLGGGWICP